MFILLFFFFFNDTATTEIYTLSLHDALPIWGPLRMLGSGSSEVGREGPGKQRRIRLARDLSGGRTNGDRKSTRLNSSHQIISYAVFCLKKKKKRNGTFNSTHQLGVIDHGEHI